MKNGKKIGEDLFTDGPLTNESSLDMQDLGGQIQVALNETILTFADDDRIDPKIEELFKAVCDEAQKTNCHDLYQQLHNSKHKLYACKYHLDAVLDEINSQKKKITTNINPNTTVHFMQTNHVLIYETESFLFQVKSCLDILVQTLGLVVGSLKSFHTFAHQGGKGNRRTGGKVIDHLNRNKEILLATLFENNRRDWIQELTAMRDIVTHKRNLEGFMCFVNSRKGGASGGKVHVPMMPNKISVEKYLRSIYSNLLQLHKECARVLRYRLIYRHMKANNFTN